jgi:platelet-activating factor acetylhydrolase
MSSSSLLLISFLSVLTLTSLLSLLLRWPDLSEQPLDDTILRHDQIKMRLLEIEECIKSVRGILGLEAAVHQKDLLLGDDYDFSSWAGKVDAERIILTGHSLGGSAVVSLLLGVR